MNLLLRPQFPVRHFPSPWTTRPAFEPDLLDDEELLVLLLAAARS